MHFQENTHMRTHAHGTRTLHFFFWSMRLCDFSFLPSSSSPPYCSAPSDRRNFHPADAPRSSPVSASPFPLPVVPRLYSIYPPISFFTVNPNTKSYKAAKRKRVEEKKRTKANPRLPPPNHPMRAVNAGVNIKPPNKGDSVRAAMRSGKSPSMLGHKEEPRKTNFTSSPFSSRSSNRGTCSRTSTLQTEKKKKKK